MVAQLSIKLLCSQAPKVDISGDVFYTCNAKLVFSTAFSTGYFADI